MIKSKNVSQDSESYGLSGLPVINTPSNLDYIKLIKVYGKSVPLGLTTPCRYKVKYNPKTRTFKFIYYCRGSDGGPYNPKSPTYEIKGSDFNPPLGYRGTDLKTKGFAYCNEFSTNEETIRFFKLRGPHGYGYDPNNSDPNKFYSYLLKRHGISRVIIRSPKITGYFKADGYYGAKEFKELFNSNLCPICGEKLRQGRSGRRGKYHKTKCKPLVDAHKQKIRNQRKTIVNDCIGTVPVRSDSFLHHLKNGKIRKGGSLRKDKMTYSMTKKEVNKYGSWKEPERLIKKGIDLHNDFDFHKCLGCLKMNRGCFPGVVDCAFPILENGIRCDKCGGKLEKFKRSLDGGEYLKESGKVIEEYEGHKIGAYDLYCTNPGCGFIPDLKSLVSK